MALETRTSAHLSGRATTGGAPEETLNVALNGGVAAATSVVAANTSLQITDIILGSAALTNIRVQQTNDGAVFFDIVQGRLAASGTLGIELATPVTITGGADVAVRVRVETPGGAAAVTCSIQGTLAS